MYRPTSSVFFFGVFVGQIAPEEDPSLMRVQVAPSPSAREAPRLYSTAVVCTPTQVDWSVLPRDRLSFHAGSTRLYTSMGANMSQDGLVLSRGELMLFVPLYAFSLAKWQRPEPTEQERYCLEKLHLRVQFSPMGGGSYHFQVKQFSPLPLSPGWYTSGEERADEEHLPADLNQLCQRSLADTDVLYSRWFFYRLTQDGHFRSPESPGLPILMGNIADSGWRPYGSEDPGEEYCEKEV